MWVDSSTHIALILLDAFLALTVFAGGIGLLAGLNAPPTGLMAGSPFSSYAIPGLSLFLIVGGCALAAVILLLCRYPLGLLVALASGAIIIGFEIVQVRVIGSDPGVARGSQVFYFALGLLIAVIAAVMSAGERGSVPKA